MEKVSIDDCTLNHTPNSVVIRLPGVIDLHGLKSHSDPSYHDHSHYMNKQGDLFITCPYRAVFVANCTCVDQPIPANIKLRSTSPWFNLRGDEFEFTGAEKIAADKKGFDSDYVILANAFFNWLNLFIKENGEKHFYQK